MMKKIALIDNFIHIDLFARKEFETANVEQVLNATGGNTGNVAFVYAIEKIIGDQLTRINWGWDPKIINKRFDHIVICAANQIGAHVDLGGWASKLENIDLPITIIGLGAQSESLSKYPEIPEGTIKFLEKLNDFKVSGSNISVRGNFTREVLQNIGVNSSVGGCPSLMISENRNLGQTLLANQPSRIEKVAVAAGNVWDPRSAFLEKNLTDLVDAYKGAYILQHPLSMMQMLLGEKATYTPERFNILLERYGHKFKENEILDWMQKNAFMFVDVPNWIRFLRHYDITVGPRYHGVALSIQGGRPGTVYTIDSRTEELSKETGIKYLNIDDLKELSIDEIVHLSKWNEQDALTFHSNRKEKVNNMIEFLKSNEIEPSKHLYDLSE